MSTQPDSRPPLRVDALLARLPGRATGDPVADCVLQASYPDPDRRWTTSGELGTAGSRFVEMERLRACLERCARVEARRVTRGIERAGTLAEALAGGDGGVAVSTALDESGDLEGEGRSGEAGVWATVAYRLAREAADPRAAEALRRSARCARGVGDLVRAMREYDDAYRLARDLGRWADAVIAATGRGNVAVDLGRWVEAEVWYFRGIALLDDAARGLPEPEARGLRWRIHQNLGITHRERGALDESELWYRRAEEASSGLDDPSAVIEIRNGRGQLALARGAAREAELHFRKSLAALEGAAANEVRVAVRANLAESLLRQGRVLDAGEAAREAEAEGIRGGHFHRLPEVYRVLARVARARGVPEAFVFLDRALELVREQGLPRLQEARTLSEYADLREAEGEVEAARDARVRAQGIIADLSDSRAGDERRDDETFTNESMDPDGGES